MCMITLSHRLDNKISTLCMAMFHRHIESIIHFKFVRNRNTYNFVTANLKGFMRTALVLSLYLPL